MINNTMLNTVGSVTYYFMQWLTTVLAVRMADFESAGVYALVISFTNIFYYLAIFGIRSYQISDVEGKFLPGEYMGTRILTMLAAVLCCGAAILLSSLPDDTLVCCAVYMLFKLGESFTDGYFAFLQLREDYRKLAVSYIAKGIIPTAVFVAALYRTGDLLSGIMWMTGGYVLCIALIDLPDLMKMRIGRPLFGRCRGILWKCVPLMLVSLSIPIMNYVTRYAVEAELNSYLLGQYASLSSVVIVMGTFSGIVFVVFIPKVSQWRREGNWKLLWQLCMYSVLAMTFMGVVVAVAGKLFGPRVCERVFGTAVLESIDLLLPLILTAILLMMKTFFSTILVPLDHRWLLLTGEYSGVLLCAVLSIPLTRYWGIQGTNWSYMTGVGLQLIVLGGSVIVAIHRKHGRMERPGTGSVEL